MSAVPNISALKGLKITVITIRHPGRWLGRDFHGCDHVHLKHRGKDYLKAKPRKCASPASLSLGPEHEFGQYNKVSICDSSGKSRKGSPGSAASSFLVLEESEWFWGKEESPCRADSVLGPIDQKVKSCQQSLVMTGDTGRATSPPLPYHTMGSRFNMWSRSPSMKYVLGHLEWLG